MCIRDRGRRCRIHWAVPIKRRPSCCENWKSTALSLIHISVMFMGRVGPVSLAMSLTAKPDDNKRKIMPVGHINVG